MAGALRIARRELRAYLVSPATYAVSVAFLGLTGITFFIVTDGSREASLRFWFPNLGFVLLVTVPIVTSRLIADEWRTRHLDVLLSRPISAAGLVVGKWLAAVALVLGLLAPTLVYAGFIAAWGRPDWPPIAAAVCSRGWRLRLLAPVPDDLEAAFLAAVTSAPPVRERGT